MNKNKRGIFLGLISAITMLSGYSFIEGLSAFNLLFFDFFNNINHPLVLFELVVFLFATTGLVSFFFNWNLLKESKISQDPKLLDDSEVIMTLTIGWKYYIHLLFCLLMVSIGTIFFISLLLGSVQTEKLLAYLIALLIIGFGIVLFRDGIQIKRYIESRKNHK